MMFERVYCVNVERRADRWESFVRGLPEDWPFKPVERFDAVDGSRVMPPAWWLRGCAGAWGCYRSHLRLIEGCLSEGVQSVLIFEDDAVFREDFTERWQQYIEKVPNTWELLYLGGQHLKLRRQKPEKINEQVNVPYNVNRTHAYAVQGSGIQKLYSHLNDVQNWMGLDHFDHHIGRLIQRKAIETYCPNEWLVGQSNIVSDITGRRNRAEVTWFKGVR